MAIRVTKLDVFKCSLTNNFMYVFKDGSIVFSSNDDGILFEEEREIKGFPDTIADIISNFFDRYDFKYMKETEAFVMYRWNETGNAEQLGYITVGKFGFNLNLLESQFAEEISTEFLSFVENGLRDKAFVSFSQFVDSSKPVKTQETKDEEIINLELNKEDNE